MRSVTLSGSRSVFAAGKAPGQSSGNLSNRAKVGAGVHSSVKSMPGKLNGKGSLRSCDRRQPGVESSQMESSSRAKTSKRSSGLDEGEVKKGSAATLQGAKLQ